MSNKDFFSGHSKLYATFGPTYPIALYDFIFKHVKNYDTAWDCGTGNGQVARYLAASFKQVYATDISQQQLENAVQADNILYSVSGAGQTNFKNNQFDLITVGQALHWFDIEKFYSEVGRVVRPDGLLAVWGYTVCTINPEIDTHVLDYYFNIVGPYWDSARKIVEEEYKNIPFPFEEITSPKFFIEVDWSIDEFAGYLTTWSATQKFIKEKGFNPVPYVMNKIEPLWKDKMNVKFPVFLKLGRMRI
jgi:ubiquinone/menaquinone biosynthesis C-methylase UbiE